VSGRVCGFQLPEELSRIARTSGGDVRHAFFRLVEKKQLNALSFQPMMIIP
jgi:hypothetical protein